MAKHYPTAVCHVTVAQIPLALPPDRACGGKERGFASLVNLSNHDGLVWGPGYFFTELLGDESVTIQMIGKETVDAVAQAIDVAGFDNHVVIGRSK